MLSRNNIVVFIIPQIIQNVIRGMDVEGTVVTSVDGTSDTNFVMKDLEGIDEPSQANTCHFVLEPLGAIDAILDSFAGQVDAYGVDGYVNGTSTSTGVVLDDV